MSIYLSLVVGDHLPGIESSKLTGADCGLLNALQVVRTSEGRSEYRFEYVRQCELLWSQSMFTRLKTSQEQSLSIFVETLQVVHWQVNIILVQVCVDKKRSLTTQE
jgi:hypothetical protein